MFVGHLGHHGIPALALDHRHNSPFVAGTNDGVALPMTHLASRFNVQGVGCSLRSRPSA
jgi:hypothetical protein